MSPEIVLFIDANQYLVLFNELACKKLVERIEKQKAHIFVTTQIVEEIQRNKLGIAARLISNQLNKLDSSRVGIPDHLFGISDDKTAEFRTRLNDLRKEATNIKGELVKVAKDSFFKMSRSEDKVSRRLKALFENAVAPTPEEMDRARMRREKGTPPGKSDQPLGDQINWEQLVSHCNNARKIWIITRDKDFFTPYEGSLLLNPALYDDLRRNHGSFPELFCFDDLQEGSTHFEKNAGVKAVKLPTEKEAQAIKLASEEIRKALEQFDAEFDPLTVVGRPGDEGSDLVYFDIAGNPIMRMELKNRNKKD